MSKYTQFKEEYTKALAATNEIGYIEKVIPPLTYASGIPGVRSREIVYFEGGEMGIVLSIDRDLAEILIFSNKNQKVGTKVTRSGRILDIPVGQDFLGKSIDPLGSSVYTGIPSPKADEYRRIDEPVLGIEHREKITETFETGVSVVDLMVPLGKGQRELVLGDRKVGKTEFLLQTMLTQAKNGAVCIYAAIGKKKLDIKKAEDFVVKNHIQNSTVIMSSSSTDPLGIIYITPYAAMTLAEYFRDNGYNVFLILDDLFTHAKFYREISLVGKRFPGRNSYPGDIFYTHSRLLERAGNFKTVNGVKSITCFPVVETIESDISGYIQTNLMSITDGHIFFDINLFEQGRRPSINYFLSVTRVGRQTQTKLRWGINRELSSFLTLLEKTQRFIHFGAEVNEGVKSTLSMGDKVLTFFDQPMGKTIPLNVQMFSYSVIWTGVMGEMSSVDVFQFVSKVNKMYIENPQFRTMVDDMISQNEDFNTLLGKIGSQSKQLAEILKK